MFCFAANRRRNSGGFTLIELLVAIALLSILAAIAVNTLWVHRQRAYDSHALTDLRHIAAAEEAYYVDNQEYLALSCAAGGTTCTPSLAAITSKGLYSDISVTVVASAPGVAPSFSGTSTSIRGTGRSFRWESAARGLQE